MWNDALTLTRMRNLSQFLCRAKLNYLGEVIQRLTSQSNRMALVGLDFRAPLRTVKRVQFGILSPDEIVSASLLVMLCVVIS